MTYASAPFLTSSLQASLGFSCLEKEIAIPSLPLWPAKNLLYTTRQARPIISPKIIIPMAKPAIVPAKNEHRCHITSTALHQLHTILNLRIGSTSVFPQQPVKDHGHSAESAGGGLQLRCRSFCWKCRWQVTAKIPVILLKVRWQITAKHSSALYIYVANLHEVTWRGGWCMCLNTPKKKIFPSKAQHYFDQLRSFRTRTWQSF